MQRRSFLGRALGTVAAGVTGGMLDRPSFVSASSVLPPPAPNLIPWKQEGPRPRLRDLGLSPGRLPPGPLNAITDVPGVRVGHSTRIEDPPPGSGLEPIRSGATAILAARPGRPAAAGFFSLNGNGELTGTEEIRATGRLESPILFTGTSSIGRVWQAAYAFMEREYGSGPFPPPVVGETWDTGLSEVRSRPVGEEQVLEALAGAGTGAVAEGAVGSGTGMECYEFKGGIGTSSRSVEVAGEMYTVGALVQANHGSRPELRVDGVPVGEAIPDFRPDEPPRRAKSILLLLATDAPLDGLQCERLARRAALGLARTGATSHHGSGDLSLALSTTGAAARALVNDEKVTPLWDAGVEAIEEAILNALCKAVTMRGARGRRVHALPIDRLVEVLIRHGRLRPASEARS